MRILFCNYEYPPLGGGGGVINALLAREMARRHEVTVFTSQGLDLPLESIENGVKIIRIPVFLRKQKEVASLFSMLTFILSGARAGKELLKVNQFDVVNTHFALPTGPVGDAISGYLGIPNVLSLHGGDLFDPSKCTSPHRHPLLRAWIRRLLGRADMIIGDSNNTLENMRYFYTKEIEGIRIPWGIQRPEPSSASRERYGFEKDEVILVTVGRLIARKNVAQLISVMDDLKKEKARLMIIGAGPQEKFLKKETFKRGLGHKVIFMGRVKECEKFQILQNCDIYVSTSRHEGFGLVFLEAMSCGLPIVCYDNGGQVDFLENMVTGYVLRLNDLAAFKERCRRLIEDSALRERFGRENLLRAEGLFIEHCAQRYETVFKEAVAKRSVKEKVL